MKPRVVFECRYGRDCYRVVIGPSEHSDNPTITIERREQDALGSEIWVPAMGIPGVVFTSLLIASGVLEKEEADVLKAAMSGRPDPMAS